MDQQLLLLAFWISWCALHSLLAFNQVKNMAEKMLGSSYRFYRLGYSILAALTLGLLLYYHFSIPAQLFWENKILRFLFAIPLILCGGLVMGVCIKKYFYELSGVQALTASFEKPVVTLQQHGLHKYVRHPLYLGTLLFVWGIFSYFPMLNNLIACGVMTIYVLIGIMLEEEKLIIEYGQQYVDYKENVPKLFPYFTKKGKS